MALAGSIWPRVVMFDLDGTLVDTMGGFADIAADVMAARHGVEWDWARGQYLETSGLPFCKQLEVIFPGHAANQDASDEFEARKLAVCEATSMDARTVEGLEALRGLGLKLVVSSNTGQTVVDAFVAREGFRFDLALGFDPSLGFDPAQSVSGLVWCAALPSIGREECAVAVLPCCGRTARIAR